MNKTNTTLIILLLVATLLFSSCNSKTITGNTPSTSEAVQATQSPKPTPTPTPIPYIEQYSDLITEYTIKLPGFEHMDREAPILSNKPKNKPRYELCEDGVYRNDNATERDSCMIMLTGDLMCQTRQQTAALDKYGEYRFRENFYVVKDVFATADLVIGNLECTLSEKATYMSEQHYVDNKPHCNAPASFLDALRYAGFDAVVTANNHACDCGVDGIFRTLDHLNENRFMHTGTFAPNDDRFIIIEVNGIKVALMSYATYFNTKDKYLTDEGVDILLNKYSEERVKADVDHAHELGAEFIIAYNHWGTEYTNTENEKQIKYAQEMANAGVDYIVGSHPHALQKYDILTADDGREVPVIYSMGNFVSHMNRTVSKDTIILQLELEKGAEGDVRIKNEGYIPCRVFETYVDYNYLVLPLSKDYNGNRESRYFEATYDRITKVIGDKIKVLGRY